MLTLGHVISALSGLHPECATHELSQAVIDSRAASPGTLFVAIPGERSDGHSFVTEAFSNGAIAALVHQDVPGDHTCIDLREPIYPQEMQSLLPPVCLRVDDSVIALQQVARYWREGLSTRVIGITGSVGKTTTKELTAAVLSRRYPTLKNEGNLNNEIGLPLSLLNMSEKHERAVLEMGFYEVGDIALLCQIARPNVGVITNIYPVHIERAGSLENIVRGKGELLEGLPGSTDGVAVLNQDDPLVMGMVERTRADVVTYGLNAQATVWASHVHGLGMSGMRFCVHHRQETLTVSVPMLGRHSVHTALRAAAVGLVEGLTWQEIVEGLQERKTRSQLRLYAVTGPDGSILVDDTYNASPESSIAALNLLDELDARRRIAVLGDMLELGPYEDQGHRAVGVRAGDVADVLVTVGDLAHIIAEEASARGMPAGHIVLCQDRCEAERFLREEIGEGDVVLIKGSRGLKLDKLVLALEVPE